MATMMTKTFVKPVLQVRSGTTAEHRPGRVTIDTLIDSDPAIDLSETEYRLIMHCRGPESPADEMTKEQQGIATRSRNHQSTL